MIRLIRNIYTDMINFIKDSDEVIYLKPNELREVILKHIKRKYGSFKNINGYVYYVNCRKLIVFNGTGVDSKDYIVFRRYNIKDYKTLGIYKESIYNSFDILEVCPDINRMLLYSKTYNYITEYNIEEAKKVGKLKFDYTAKNFEILDEI